MKRFSRRTCPPRAVHRQALCLAANKVLHQCKGTDHEWQRERERERERERGRRLLLLAVSIASLLILFAATALPASANIWTTVYQTDFSTNPAWKTNDPNDPPNLYWDEATESFHVWQSNDSWTYAYKYVDYVSGTSFRLQFDQIIDSAQNTTGLPFGLFSDDRILAESAASVWVFTGGDHWSNIYYTSEREAVHEICNWQPGVWYTVLLEYDAYANMLTMTGREKATGNTITSLTFSDCILSSDLNQIALTNLDYQSLNNTNTIEYHIDNITFEVTPEPATLSLLAAGGLGMWLRRRRKEK